MLREAQQLGYALSRGERSAGVTSVGAPIWNADGEVAASINLSGPSERIEQHSIEELGRAVREAGLAISSNLGYGPTKAVRAGAHAWQGVR